MFPIFVYLLLLNSIASITCQPFAFIPPEPENVNYDPQSYKWPQEYKFDDERIDKLTGYEEPLKHMKIMPYRADVIDTRFRLHASSSTNMEKFLQNISY